MRITFVCFTTIRGGAAKATNRFKQLLDNDGLDTEVLSIENNVKSTQRCYLIIHYIFWILSYLLTMLQRDKQKGIKCSLNIFGNKYIKNKIITTEFLHIHWINNETLKISDFPLLSNKSIITLHDEWFYCGTEHLAFNKDVFNRVVNGYSKNNKISSGLDLSRFIWNQKVRHYANLNNVIFTVPSNWMKDRVKMSFLLGKKDVRVLPNPINTDIFKRKNIRNKSDFVIIYGAVGGIDNYNKGFDLLEKALKKMSETVSDLTNIKLVIFGGQVKRTRSLFGINVSEIGYVNSEDDLAELYSLASITVVPSRIESFGQIAAESLSCETPVVAFNYSGLKDIIQHYETGFLAEPFNTNSLFEGILWLYNLTEKDRRLLGVKGREFILQNFSNDIVCQKLISMYEELGWKKN